jgi:hypothetical protein
MWVVLGAALSFT